MNRLQKIEEMLQNSPDDLFLNYAYAMEFAKEGRISEAREIFAQVRSLDANYVPAYFQEAQMLAGEGDIEPARELLERGIQVARATGDAHALGEMTDFLDNL